jgi:hypothetical protein
LILLWDGFPPVLPELSVPVGDLNHEMQHEDSTRHNDFFIDLIPIVVRISRNSKLTTHPVKFSRQYERGGNVLRQLTIGACKDGEEADGKAVVNAFEKLKDSRSAASFTSLPVKPSSEACKGPSTLENCVG